MYSDSFLPARHAGRKASRARRRADGSPKGQDAAVQRLSSRQPAPAEARTVGRKRSHCGLPDRTAERRLSDGAFDEARAGIPHGDLPPTAGSGAIDTNQAGTTASEAINLRLKFIRNVLCYRLPRDFMAISKIQTDVFTQRNIGDFSFFSKQMESLFSRSPNDGAGRIWDSHAGLDSD